jgi:hypothetical protein
MSLCRIDTGLPEVEDARKRLPGGCIDGNQEVAAPGSLLNSPLADPRSKG